jgi:ribosomal protein L32
MGRLLDRLKSKCRRCGHWHIPHRLQAMYLDGTKTKVKLLECRECGHLWREKNT